MSARPSPLIPKAALVVKLRALVPPRGRRPKDRLPGTELRDVASYLGVSHKVLYEITRQRREVDDALQMQLSLFFLLWDREEIVKREGVLHRVMPKGVKPDAPRPTIDISTGSPRINWMASWR